MSNTTFAPIPIQVSTISADRLVLHPFPVQSINDQDVDFLYRSDIHHEVSRFAGNLAHKVGNPAIARLIAETILVGAYAAIASAGPDTAQGQTLINTLIEARNQVQREVVHQFGSHVDVIVETPADESLEDILISNSSPSITSTQESFGNLSIDQDLDISGPPVLLHIHPTPDRILYLSDDVYYDTSDDELDAEDDSISIMVVWDSSDEEDFDDYGGYDSCA